MAMEVLPTAGKSEPEIAPIPEPAIQPVPEPIPDLASEIILPQPNTEYEDGDGAVSPLIQQRVQERTIGELEQELLTRLEMLPEQVVKDVPAPADEEVKTDESLLAKLADYGTRAAKDFGKGVFTESVRAVGRGMLKELPKRMQMAVDAPGQAWLDLVVRPALKGVGGPGSEKMVDQGITDLMVEMRKGQEETGVEIAEPKTTTGKMIEELAVWAVPVSKLKTTSELILALTRIPARVATFLQSPVAFGIAAGVLADPMKNAIDEAIAENPGLEDPIRAAIEAQDQPTLDAALGRIEEAVVGTLWGIGADLAVPVLKFGVRVLRASGKKVHRAFGGQPGEKPPKGTPEEPVPPLDEGVPKTSEKDIRIGDPNKPKISMKAGPLGEERIKEAEETIRRIFGDSYLSRIELKIQAERLAGMDLNLENVRRPEDVVELLDQATKFFSEGIEKARRGTRSQDLSAAAAKDIERQSISVDLRDQLRNNPAAQGFAKFFGLGTVDDLVLERPQAAAYNAEQTLAAVAVWSQAARVLDDIIRQSDSTAPSGLEQVRFRRALAAFGAISAQIMGIRAEAGRALNIWSRVWKDMGGDAERAMVISRMLEENGGQKTTVEMMQRYKQARKNGLSPRQIGEISSKGALAKTIEAFNESVISGYLWLPTTHLVNMMSPYIMLAAAMSDRAVARQLQKITGLSGEMGVATGEPQALLEGAARGLRMMVPNAQAIEELERAAGLKALEAGGTFSSAKAFFSLYAQQLKESAKGQGIKLEDKLGAIQTMAHDMDPGVIRSALDLYGSMATVPGHALIAEDLISRGVAYEASRQALALRYATHAGGTAEEIAARYATLVKDPPEALRLQAIKEAEALTFTGQAGEHVLGAAAGRSGIFTTVRRIPILGPLMIPFVNVLANITREGIERSPLAPFAYQWRAEIAKGGAARDIALAKAVTGTLMMGAIFDLAESGQITGRYPSDPGDRRAWQNIGKTDYSVKIGDHWVRLTALGPLMLPIAMAGTLYQVMQERVLDDEDTTGVLEILGGMIKATESVLESQTTAKGIAVMIDAIRRQDEPLLRALERSIQGTMPASTALRFLKRGRDPTIPDVNSAWDAVQAQIVGLEESLPRVRNIHGYPIQDEEEFGRGWALFSPVRVSRERGFPIDKEMVKHNMNIDGIRKKTDFDGVPVNFRAFPKVYEAYVELAGHGLVLPDYGSRVDYLNEVVSAGSKRKAEHAQYKTMTNGRHGQKRAWVYGIVKTYEEMAQAAILYPNSEAGQALTKAQKEQLSGAEFNRFRQYVRDLKVREEAAAAAGVSR